MTIPEEEFLTEKQKEERVQQAKVFFKEQLQFVVDDDELLADGQDYEESPNEVKALQEEEQEDEKELEERTSDDEDDEESEADVAYL